MKLTEATPIVAILALAALEGIALATHTDGAAFGIVIAAIAGLGGYQVKKIVSNRQQIKEVPANPGKEQP